MANAVKPGQPPLLRRSLQLDVDMDHVAGPLPLVAMDRRFGIQVPQPVQPQAPHRPSQGADQHHQQPGDPPEGAALVPEFNGLLQLLRIQRPPLPVANARSARAAGPPERKRASHLRAVRSLMPWSAAS